MGGLWVDLIWRFVDFPRAEFAKNNKQQTNKKKPAEIRGKFCCSIPVNVKRRFVFTEPLLCCGAVAVLLNVPTEERGNEQNLIDYSTVLNPDKARPYLKFTAVRAHQHSLYKINKYLIYLNKKQHNMTCLIQGGKFGIVPVRL